MKKIRIVLVGDRTPGRRHGMVVDDNGEMIGDAQDYTYGGTAFAVRTPKYGGYVPLEHIKFVKPKTKQI